MNPAPSTLQPIATPWPPKLGAVLGLAAAGVLVVNLLKVAGVLPVSTATQLLAPTGQALAVIFVLCLSARALPATWWATTATAVNVLALTFGVGVEYVLNFVLRVVSADTRSLLLQDSLGTALVLTSVIFLVGSVGFCVALWRARRAPGAFVIGYAVAAVVVSARPVVPEGIFLAGLAALIAAIVLLSIWMLPHPMVEPVGT